MRISKRVALTAALVVTSMHAVGQTLADQLNTMSAQVQLLRKRVELNQALAQSAGVDVASLPRVIAVYGMEKKLQARLLMASGMVSTFEEGDTIRGSMKVAAITPKAVIVAVSKGKGTKDVAMLPLDFVTGATMPGSGPGGAIPLPGGPLGGASSGPVPPELLPAPPVVAAPYKPEHSAAAAPAAPLQPPASAVAQGAK